jgi:hypothetical protein
MKRGLVLVLATVLAVLGIALIVRAAPAVTPIVGGTTWDTAVAISPGVEYEASVSSTHLDDWFYIDVNPGQILTLPFSTTNTWSSSFFYLYDQTHMAPHLAAQYGTASGQSFVWHWMGSNLGGSSTPTRYYFMNHWLSGTNVYRFSFTLADQHDGGATGDAGGDFANALVLSLSETTPSVMAPNNLLGGSDQSDYYLIKLPPQVISQPPVEYLFILTDLAWPEGFGGYINIQLYNSQRVPDNNRKKLITAPAVTLFTWDITDCGSEGCYISFTPSLPNKWYQLGYSLRVAPKQRLYLPDLHR